MTKFDTDRALQSAGYPQAAARFAGMAAMPYFPVGKTRKIWYTGKKSIMGFASFCAESKRRRGMRTYLVTGGAGFIGSNYIHYMFRKYDNEIRIINVDAADLCGQSRELKGC